MSRTLAILFLSTCLGVAPSGLFARPLDCIRPSIMVASDNAPFPGETVTYTVTLSGTATSAGYLSISSTTLSNFATLPSEASYNAGDSSVTFTGTLATTAAVAVEVSASNSAGSVELIEHVSRGGINIRQAH